MTGSTKPSLASHRAAHDPTCHQAPLLPGAVPDQVTEPTTTRRARHPSTEGRSRSRQSASSPSGRQAPSATERARFRSGAAGALSIRLLLLTPTRSRADATAGQHPLRDSVPCMIQAGRVGVITCGLALATFGRAVEPMDLTPPHPNRGRAGLRHLAIVTVPWPLLGRAPAVGRGAGSAGRLGPQLAAVVDAEFLHRSVQVRLDRPDREH